ncbi:PAS/PAC sensor signal transduction histidine kinase [Haladaptatus litoreus]|uniref:histidine kinase n=1 Tax=Haladaptatus litoreus TaxID=553468 RepID=A0A1N7D967_9EURY|nr:ATP-binding protein [Haladaptatus litoreus]SIR72274.1 PAS/PAC sensor signal transduction histidine kinase [Haladaptatus litoreus]
MNGYMQTSKEKILLLIDHRRNRRLLADWLASEYNIVLPEDDIDASFDLCIADETLFSQYRDKLRAWKESELPTFLPYLLVTSTSSPARTPKVWQGVDEVITTPIEKAVLRARINGLLERRRLSVEIEREKKQSEKRFQTLFQTAPDPVFVLNADGRIQAVNDAFCKVSGLDRSTVLGEHVEDIHAFPNDSLERLTADIHEPEEDDQLPPYSVTYMAPDGETRYAEINTARMQFNTENPEIIGIFRDMTEHKHRKQELKHQNERLDEFASMLAHELRNPLGIAQGYLQLAEFEDADDAFDEVREAHNRMERMINEMLDLARRSEAIDDKERTGFHDIIESAWSRIAPPEATLVLENVDIEISADVDRLSQVFENLFRNAVEHGGENVTVRVERLPDGVCVEDDGPGIPSEYHDTVFESGYTTNNGTGLGLSIAQQIVEAHGWDIAVMEGTRGGARFEITGIQFGERT